MDCLKKLSTEVFYTPYRVILLIGLLLATSIILLAIFLLPNQESSKVSAQTTATGDTTISLVRVSNELLTEGESAQFRVSLPEGMVVGEDLSVMWAVTCASDETGMQAEDFGASECPQGAAVIRADTTASDTVTIDTTTDDILEGGAFFTVNLVSVNPATVGEATFILGAPIEYSAFVLEITDTEDAAVSVSTATSDAAVSVSTATSNVTGGDAAIFAESLPDGVAKDEPLSEKSEVDCSSIGGTPNADDFGDTCPPGTVVIAVGETLRTSAVDTELDLTLREDDETSASNLLDTGLPESFAIREISPTVDTTPKDDTAVFVIDSPTSVDEGNEAIFALSLSGTLASSVTLAVSIAGCDGGTDPGITASDFGDACPNININILANTMDGMEIAVLIGRDNLIEGPEKFQILVEDAENSGSDASPIFRSTSDMVTINDRESTDIAITVSTKAAATADESVPAVFRVSLPDGITAADDITVGWEVTCGNSPGITVADFGGTCPSGQTVIRAGMSTGILTIPIADDNLIEGDETFTLTLTGAVGVMDTSFVTSDTASYTIEDNDRGFASISITDTMTNETDEGTIAFKVEIKGAGGESKVADEEIAVMWAIDPACGNDNRLGITPADFMSTPNPCDGGTVMIAANTRSATLNLRVMDDAVLENNETFTIALSRNGVTNDFGGSITVSDTMSRASVTIMDDDAPVIAISATTSTVDEGSAVTFTFRMIDSDEPLESAVGLAWSIADCSTTAIAGIDRFDFTSTGATSCPSGTVTLAAGASNGVVGTATISIRSDNLIEGPEAFRLEINEAGSTLGNPKALRVTDTPSDTVTINDAESTRMLISVALASSVVISDERGAPLFRLSLPNGITADEVITVNWAVTCEDRTTEATEADFAAPTACQGYPAMIRAGLNSNTFHVSIEDDDLIEGDESFTLSLVDAGGINGATLGVSNTPTARYTIRDIERGTVSIEGTSTSISEDSATDPSINVKLSKKADEDIIFVFGATCGSGSDTRTKLSKSDFSGDSRDICGRGERVTLRAGRTSVSLDISIDDDNDREDTEKLTIRLDKPAKNFDGRVAVDQNKDTVDLTIKDDDIVASLSTLASVNEGEDATFTISLLGGSGSGTATDADKAVKVGWRITCINAEDADFGDTSKACGDEGEVRITSGRKKVTLDIPTKDDNEFEADESFDVELISVSDGGKYTNTFSTTKQRVIIKNDGNEFTQQASPNPVTIVGLPPPPSATITARGNSGAEIPDNLADIMTVIEQVDQTTVSSAVPPAGVLFVTGSVVTIDIVDTNMVNYGNNAFFRGAEVCLGITDEALNAVEGRAMSLSLYHFQTSSGTWERLVSELDSAEENICGNVDGFSQFALGYPAPIERALLITLPPTGGVTLSVWAVFTVGLFLGVVMVISGGVFVLRRRS